MIKKSSTCLLIAAMMMAWALVGIPLAAQAGAGGDRDLTGQWELNRSQSEDLQAKLGSMGGGHHGGGGGGPQDDIFRAMMNAPARLVGCPGGFFSGNTPLGIGIGPANRSC